MGPRLHENTETDELKTAKQHPDTHYRREQIKRRIVEKFDEIYSAYKTEKKPEELTYEDKMHNLELFAKKNVEWKQFCYKSKQTQKLETPNVWAFQNKISADQNKPDAATAEVEFIEIKDKFVAFDDHLRLGNE